MKKTGYFRMVIAVLMLTLSLTLPAGAADESADAAGAQGMEKKSGLVTEDGEAHIYTDAEKLVKNVPVYVLKADGKTAYFSVDEDGNAKKLTGVMEMAAKRLVRLKAGDKKTMANLKKAFKWSAGLRYRNNTKKIKGSRAAQYYGEYGFRTLSGDCNTAAYTFWWMGKVLGYSPAVVNGKVPDGSADNLKKHTWVTMKMDKKTWVFDPDFNRTYAGKTVKTRSGKKKLGKYCGFRFTYGTPGTYMYRL